MDDRELDTRLTRIEQAILEVQEQILILTNMTESKEGKKSEKRENKKIKTKEDL